MSWFKQYPPGTPVRQIANVEENNRIRRILDDIKGIGCRIEKPRGANGMGWRIIVGDGTDEDPIPDSMIGTDTGQIPTRPYDLQSSIGVPPGVIVMWSGTVATIPLTWALCDGSNGTPDLRHKFIRGAAGDTGTDYAGQTGGADSHGHSASGSVAKSAFAHGHPHTHDIALTSFESDSAAGSTRYVGQSITETADTAQANSITWGDTGTTVAASVTVSNASAIPAFYALAYIMKL